MQILKKLTLIQKILIGMISGLILGLLIPKVTLIGILGDLFIGSLKAIAPLLVFAIILSSIAQHQKGQKTNLKTVIKLYLLGTFFAAVTAVVVSFVFPIKIPLNGVTEAQGKAKDATEIIKSLIIGIVDNPLKALIEGNYLSILFWATLSGLALRKSSRKTKELISEATHALQDVVSFVIACAPLGILGLVFSSIATSGIASLMQYSKLILVLVGSMTFSALVVYPFIVLLVTRQNPYPLVLFCLKESGIPAFFTRSSAANIPVNLDLAKQMKLDETSYSISIPLGSAINMGGAAITISIMTLAATHTLNIQVNFATALLLSVVSALAACGASGIAGGSLLLIPLSCSLFGISNDIAMKIVSVGFIINIVQDSMETALNSSSDLIFTAAADLAKNKRKFIRP